MQAQLTRRFSLRPLLVRTVWRSLLAFRLAGETFGASIILRPDADTSLLATLPDNNFGANSNLVAGANGSGFPSRTLMHFNVATQIPSQAIIESAALNVNVVILPSGGGVSSVFDLRRILVPWNEGAGTGNSGRPAVAGETTWNSRIHPTTPWVSVGGAVSNDYAGTVSATVSLAGFGSAIFGSSASLVADVQQWLINPSENFGWVIMSESEETPSTARRLGAREDLINSPLLEIHYRLPVPELQGVKAEADRIQFSFLAFSGQPYTVQYRDSFASEDWLTLTNIAPQTITTNLTVSDPFLGLRARYYRVGNF